MSSPTPNASAIQERINRANEWKTFRKTFLFSQRNLADAIHLSRRTIQAIEAARVNPQYSTQRKFRDLRIAQERTSSAAA